MLKPLKWYKKLHTSKGRKQQGYFLIEGPRQAEQVLLSGKDKVSEILIEEGFTYDIPGDVSVRVLTSSQFKDLSFTKKSQGIIVLAKIPDDYFSNSEVDFDCSGILILENIQDPGNVGTLIRTASAFGFDQVVLNKGCADPYSPKAVLSTGGAVYSTKIIKNDDISSLIDDLQLAKIKVVAADLRGEVYSSFKELQRLALVLGNEGNGISDTVRLKADILYKIPLRDEAVESLNVSAAGAVAMFAAERINIKG